DNRTGKTFELPIENGAVRALDLRQMKTGPEDFGLMTYDPAFMNTASCKSQITFIDGDKGILLYRGYPIDELAEQSTYLEVAYRHSLGLPYAYPDNDLNYCGNFLNMMFKMSETKYRPHPVLERALDVLFILHADHEQNCSTSAVRTVGSSRVDPYSAIAGGVA